MELKDLVLTNLTIDSASSTQHKRDCLGTGSNRLGLIRSSQAARPRCSCSLCPLEYSRANFPWPSKLAFRPRQTARRGRERGRASPSRRALLDLSTACRFLLANSHLLLSAWLVYFEVFVEAAIHLATQRFFCVRCSELRTVDSLRSPSHRSFSLEERDSILRRRQLTFFTAVRRPASLGFATMSK